MSPHAAVNSSRPAVEFWVTCRGKIAQIKHKYDDVELGEFVGN